MCNFLAVEHRSTDLDDTAATSDNDLLGRLTLTAPDPAPLGGGSEHDAVQVPTRRSVTTMLGMQPDHRYAMATVQI